MENNKPLPLVDEMVSRSKYSLVHDGEILISHGIHLVNKLQMYFSTCRVLTIKAVLLYVTGTDSIHRYG